MLIVPEWYFLPFYAILRAIPNKLFGVIAMFSVFLILALLPFISNSRSSITSTKLNSFYNIYYAIFISTVILLGWLGQCIVEEPYIICFILGTLFYTFVICFSFIYCYYI